MATRARFAPRCVRPPRFLPSSSSSRSRIVRCSSSMSMERSSPVVLGIETSCDDTALAVVTGNREILYSASKSQWAEHWKLYKGVHPALALQEHENALPRMLEEWQKNKSAVLGDRTLTAIAVTSGPGLALALKVGVKAAEEFAKQENLPLLGINHLAAHTLVARLREPALEFPFLSLLISGGHSQLLLCDGVDKFQLLGGTHDDSIGEAYDKVARLLNLDASNMPAGEALQIAAEKTTNPLRFTVPLKGTKGCNFSFSGLKAQVTREVTKLGVEDLSVVHSIAAGFQNAAIEHLMDRTSRALAMCAERGVNVKALTVVGGVARNTKIRAELAKLCIERSLSLVVPPMELCSDNGVMIAWTGVEQIQAGIAQPANEPLIVQPRWQLDTSFNPRVRNNTKSQIS